jgi:thiamine pyrophosphate-dependent acetolactate synthase large subunit-like protein
MTDVLTTSATQGEIQVELPIGLDGERTAQFGSDAVVDLLRELGVRYLPMNPGSSFRGLHDSVVNYGGNRDPQLLLCLHEEVAIAIAHGYANATGGLGVAVVHDLVGLMHGSMAVYNAYCDRAPVLVLGGSGPADPGARRPIDWSHSANTQAGLVRDFVVWDAEPPTAQASVNDIVRAVQRTLSVPQGPSYVSLDAAVQEGPLPAELWMPDLDLMRPAPPLASDPGSVAAAARLLAGAQRPVVIAGRVGLDVAVTAPLVELVELLGAGYHNDRNIVAFPTSHPANLTGDSSLLREADVVLAIDVVDIPGILMPKDMSVRSAANGGAGLPAVIDLSAGDLGLRSWSNAFSVPVPRSVQLLADPVLGLRQLLEAVRDLVDAEAAAERRSVLAERSTALRERRLSTFTARRDETPIAPSRMVAELWAAVQDEPWLLCLRNHRTWPEGLWEFDGAGDYLGQSAGGGVGHGPGAIVGGALAARDQGRLGIGIVGDGDFLASASALWTAVHYRIPLVMVVNDNSSLFNDEQHQAEVARHRGREVANNWIGMRIDEPAIDIAGLARSFGCHAVGPIVDPGDLAAAMTDAVAVARAGGVAVVHVRTAHQ